MPLTELAKMDNRDVTNRACTVSVKTEHTKSSPGTVIDRRILKGGNNLQRCVITGNKGAWGEKLSELGGGERVKNLGKLKKEENEALKTNRRCMSGPCRMKS